MKRLMSRLGWACVGALGIIFVLALARATTAGPLDPPGPVGSTMRTLDGLMPTWDQKRDSTGGCTSQRFTCVMDGAAVLDRETGLVWQRQPLGAGNNTWEQANNRCLFADTGGRNGWRSPTAYEGLSVGDPTTASLPAGHPFMNVTAPSYISSTSASAFFGYVFVPGGFLAERPKTTEPTSTAVWCVRGP